MLITQKTLARAFRVPVPRVTWIKIVLRAEEAYGFAGDESSLTRAILRGKIASLYRYASELREHALEQYADEDNDARGTVDPQPAPEFGGGDAIAEESGEEDCGVPGSINNDTSVVV